MQITHQMDWTNTTLGKVGMFWSNECFTKAFIHHTKQILFHTGLLCQYIPTPHGVCLAFQYSHNEVAMSYFPLNIRAWYHSLTCFSSLLSSGDISHAAYVTDGVFRLCSTQADIKAPWLVTFLSLHHNRVTNYILTCIRVIYYTQMRMYFAENEETFQFDYFVTNVTVN